jgi:hypothetical protein
MSGGDLMQVTAGDPLSVLCTRCGAPRGQQCRRVSDWPGKQRKAREPHAARIKAAAAFHLTR